jgi:hypothetical protein
MQKRWLAAAAVATVNAAVETVMQRATLAEPLPEPFAERMATSYKVEAGAFVERPFEIVANFSPAGALRR